MDDQEKRMTRREYREQQEQQNRKQTQPEHDARLQDDHDNDVAKDGGTPDQPIVGAEVSREEQLIVDHEKEQAAKTDHLKKKLNMVIGGLLVAIVIVYLILFFVG